MVRLTSFFLLLVPSFFSTSVEDVPPTQPVVSLDASDSQSIGLSSSSSVSLSSCGLPSHPWKEELKNVKSVKGHTFTTLHGEPKMGVTPPTHSRKCAERAIPTHDPMSSVVCKVPNSATINSTNTGSFTVVPSHNLFAALRDRFLSMAELRISGPCRPYVYLDAMRGTTRRDEVISTLRDFSDVFAKDPVVLKWGRFFGIPKEYDFDRELLVWNSDQHFETWQSYHTFITGIRESIRTQLCILFPKDLPFPGSVDRQMVLKVEDEMMRSADVEEIGWWPVDAGGAAFRPRTLSEYENYLPTVLKQSSEPVFVPGGDNLVQRPVSVDDLFGPTRVVENAMVPYADRILAHLRVRCPSLRPVPHGAFSRGARDDGVFRSGDRLFCKFATGEDTFTCPHGVVHQDANGFIEASWGTDSIATVVCHDHTANRVFCPELSIGLDDSARNTTRWRATYRFLVKHNLNRPDFPITESDWGIYRRSKIKEFFLSLDPGWDFDNLFGYHRNTAEEHAMTQFAMDMDFIRYLRGGDDEIFEPVFPYLNLFLAYSEGKIAIRQVSGYAQVSPSFLKDVALKRINYREKVGKRNVVKPLCPVWLELGDPCSFTYMENLPLDLNRFKKAASGTHQFQRRQVLNRLTPPGTLQLDRCLAQFEGSPLRPYITYLLDTLYYFMCGGEVDSSTVPLLAKLLKNWAGRALTRYGTPQPTMMIIVGDSGTGKSTFFQLLSCKIGPQNTCKKNLVTILTKPFDNEFNKPFIIAEEMNVEFRSSDERTAFENKYKDWVTRLTHDASQKYGSETVHQESVSTKGGTANDLKGLPIDCADKESQRRNMVLTPVKVEDQESYIAAHPFISAQRSIRDRLSFFAALQEVCQQDDLLGLAIGYLVHDQDVNQQDVARKHIHELLIETDASRFLRRTQMKPVSRFIVQIAEHKRLIVDAGVWKQLIVPENIDPNTDASPKYVAVQSMQAAFFQSQVGEPTKLPPSQFQPQMERLISLHRARLSLIGLAVESKTCHTWKWDTPAEGRADGPTPERKWIRVSAQTQEFSCFNMDRMYEAHVPRPLRIVRHAPAALDTTPAPTPAGPLRTPSPNQQDIANTMVRLNRSNTSYFHDWLEEAPTLYQAFDVDENAQSGEEDPSDAEDLNDRAIRDEDAQDAAEAFREDYDHFDGFIDDEPVQPRKQKKRSRSRVSRKDTSPSPSKVPKDKEEDDGIVLHDEDELLNELEAMLE